MRSLAQLSPVVPLPGGGRGRVPVIEVARLCDELVALCLTPSPPLVANLFHRDLPTLRELVLAAAAEGGKRPMVLPIPFCLALPAMRLIERMGLKLPVSSDSLVGFLSNQTADYVSTLEE